MQNPPSEDLWQGFDDYEDDALDLANSPSTSRNTQENDSRFFAAADKEARGQKVDAPLKGLKNPQSLSPGKGKSKQGALDKDMIERSPEKPASSPPWWSSDSLAELEIPSAQPAKRAPGDAIPHSPARKRQRSASPLSDGSKRANKARFVDSDHSEPGLSDKLPGDGDQDSRRPPAVAAAASKFRPAGTVASRSPKKTVTAGPSVVKPTKAPRKSGGFLDALDAVENDEPVKPVKPPKDDAKSPAKGKGKAKAKDESKAGQPRAPKSKISRDRHTLTQMYPKKKGIRPVLPKSTQQRRKEKENQELLKGVDFDDDIDLTQEELRRQREEESPPPDPRTLVMPKSDMTQEEIITWLASYSKPSGRARTVDQFTRREKQIWDSISKINQEPSTSQLEEEAEERDANDGESPEKRKRRAVGQQKAANNRMWRKIGVRQDAAPPSKKTWAFHPPPSQVARGAQGGSRGGKYNFWARGRGRGSNWRGRGRAGGRGRKAQ